MWLKLLSSDSMSTLMRPQFVNGKWRKAEIGGAKKRQLKKYFERAGVPWIYDKEKPEIHEASPYNRKPKGSKFNNNYETRLAIIRKNLSQMDEKLHKLRVDNLTNKKPTKDEENTISIWKALNAA